MGDQTSLLIAFPSWKTVPVPGCCGYSEQSEISPQRLDLGVGLACIHCQLDALVLHLRELSAQLGVLGRQGEQKQSVGNGWPPMAH